MNTRLNHIYRLGVKELWSLLRDPMMLVLIVYTFSFSIYIAATAMPESLHNAAIAIIDQDASPLSARIASAFYPPHFKAPQMIDAAHADAGLDQGDYTFVLDIPPNYQRDTLAGRQPALQLNIDATRMSQALPATATSSRSSPAKWATSCATSRKRRLRRSIWRCACASIRIWSRPGSAR